LIPTASFTIFPPPFACSCWTISKTCGSQHAVPTIYQFRPFVAAGGLASYGSDETEFYRLVGVYAGKILNGDKPANLPIQQTTRVELIVNLKTAKAFGIPVPQSVQSRANEVIE
jgi:ABC-type uncharacterized transport system substrate-binding protein